MNTFLTNSGSLSENLGNLTNFIDTNIIQPAINFCFTIFSFKYMARVYSYLLMLLTAIVILLFNIIFRKKRHRPRKKEKDFIAK